MASTIARIIEEDRRVREQETVRSGRARWSLLRIVDWDRRRMWGRRALSIIAPAWRANRRDR